MTSYEKSRIVSPSTFLRRRDDGEGLRRCSSYWGVQITWREELVSYAVNVVDAARAAGKESVQDADVVFWE